MERKIKKIFTIIFIWLFVAGNSIVLAEENHQNNNSKKEETKLLYIKENLDILYMT